MGDRPTETQLGRYFTVQDHLNGLVIQGVRPAEYVTKVLQQLAEGQPFQPEVSPYANLTSLWAQFAMLESLNRYVWGGRLTEQELSALKLRLDLEQPMPPTGHHLHVEFGTMTETILMWWAALEWVFRSTDQEISIVPGAIDLHPQARRYDSGTHIVHMDWVNGHHPVHQRPADQPSVAELRMQISENGGWLAQAEVLSFLTLNASLVSSMDGDRLPLFLIMPGYQVESRRPTLGERWTHVPSIMHTSRGLVFTSHRVRDSVVAGAVPAVLPI